MTSSLLCFSCIPLTSSVKLTMEAIMSAALQAGRASSIPRILLEAERPPVRQFLGEE
jgi:hypothetical protein